jgi:hypothetical protein
MTMTPTAEPPIRSAAANFLDRAGEAEADEAGVPERMSTVSFQASAINPEL